MRNTRVIATRYGGPEVLRVAEEEGPKPKAGEVRVRVLAVGVALPDVMAREGIHPETPPVPFTPGWDLVGVVDEVGADVSGHRPRPDDAAEAVSLVLNYITAYQMTHRSAEVRPGQGALIHGAAGGVGTALLQLGRLAGLQTYGTCSARGAPVVSDLGGTRIDYQHQDFVKEIRRLTGEGVDVVFDHIGGAHLWHSPAALPPGGSVVGYGAISSIRGKGLSSMPLVAQRFPLAEARHAHELLGQGGVIGKFVLVPEM